MPEKPSHHESGSSSPSTAAVWAVLFVVSACGLLFLYAIFDAALFFLILFVLAVLGIGGMHYLLWGRQMGTDEDSAVQEDV